mmetsp:Transcript_67050/g.106123  ORF Transcript_67050/g.106123 Transcript_67050/m.106123 type:complete len:228 (-) Transcript_67050:454-1137(-)
MAVDQPKPSLNLVISVLVQRRLIRGLHLNLDNRRTTRVMVALSWLAHHRLRHQCLPGALGPSSIRVSTDTHHQRLSIASMVSPRLRLRHSRQIDTGIRDIPCTHITAQGQPEMPCMYKLAMTRYAAQMQGISDIYNHRLSWVGCSPKKMTDCWRRRCAASCSQSLDRSGVLQDHRPHPLRGRSQRRHRSKYLDACSVVRQQALRLLIIFVLSAARWSAVHAWMIFVS